VAFKGVIFIPSFNLFYGMSKGDAHTEKIYKQLGQRFKAIRISKGYSSHERFANEHNISRAQYAKYEKGKDIQFSTMLRIIEAFGMSLKDFFSEGFDHP
jgi:DNA-binding XRE family transcriptional regulator